MSDLINIGESEDTSKIQLQDQAGVVSNPTAGFHRTYSRADGLYVLDSAGDETGPLGTGGGGGAGSDTTAIHDDTAGEIAAITEKASPISADLILIEDSAAGNVKKRVQIGNLPSSGGGGAKLLLNYVFTTDQADNVAIAAAGWTDVIANQSFTVDDGDALVEIVYAGNIVVPGSSTYASRISIDDGASTHVLGGGSGAAGFATGAPVFIDGLTVGVHTVKLQMNASVVSTDTAYCRCLTVPQEHLALRVMQFAKA